MAWKGDPNNKVPNVGNAKGDFSNTVVQKSDNLSDKKIEVNRAHETRRDNDTQKDVTVTLYDVDTAIMRQIEKFQLTVPDNGQNIKVPTFYASPEKWKSIQVDGFMRDYQGKIILPAIVFSRTTSEKNRNMMLFNRYLSYTVMKKYSDKNRYTPFSVLVGQNVPINEVYNIVMPDHMIFTYHFIIWAEYQQQINKLVERLNFEAEDFWGDKRGYRFQVKLDSISHTIQLSADDNRMVKAEFDLQVFGYLLPDVIDYFTGKQDTTRKFLTPKKVVIGTEVVADSVNVETERNLNSEKWRNQNYPNLSADTNIPSPSVVFTDVVTQFKFFEKLIQSISITIQNNSFHFPAPSNSSDAGEDGQVSYDSDYYYVHTSGEWKRVPISLFNALNTF